MATKKLQILDSLNKNAVLYTPQELTEEEKIQVRENIGVPSLDENGKIPVSQLPDDIGSSGGGLTEVAWEDIKNKPFDATINLTSIIESQSITTMNFEDEMGAPVQGIPFEAQGAPMTDVEWYDKVQVSFDGVVYNVTKKYFEATGNYYLGNGSIFNFMGAGLEDTGEPFVIMLVTDNYVAGYVFFTTDTQETEHTVSMSALSETIKTLDPKYIADMYYDTRKTSYYSQAENPNPLTVNNTMMNMSCYKISDLIPTRDEIFHNCKVTINGKIYEFKESGIQIETDDFVYVVTTGSDGATFNFIFVNKSGTLNFTYSGYPMSLECPEAGIYYQRQLNAGVPEGRTIEFIIEGELKQIDPKFIPGNLDFDFTIDPVPTQGSKNPVESSGVHSALTELESRITSTFCYKGTKENYSDLPMTDNAVGDVWNILNSDPAHDIESGDNVAWDGTKWDVLAGIMDMSGYYTKAEVDNIALSGEVNLSNYYTKSEVHSLIENESDNIDLSDYYTKSEVDSALDNVNVDLSDYYTKSEINNGYYTKTEIDNIIGDIDTVLDEISTLIGE